MRGGRQKRGFVRVALAIALGTIASGAHMAVAPGAVIAAERAELVGTPFESGPNAAALDELERGATVRRSSFEGTLTADDRARLAPLGMQYFHQAAVVLHKLPKEDPRELRAHLEVLRREVDRFAPSGVCGTITSNGDGTGLCTGHAPGPFGRAPLRMPFAVRVTEEPRGVLRVVFTNSRQLQAKPFLAWTPVVDPERIKIIVDLYPVSDGWLVYTRLGVEMKKHVSASRLLADAMLRLDAWLARDLGGH